MWLKRGVSRFACLHIAVPANFALLADLSAAEERCYPDETFHPYYSSPSYYGRVTIRITSR